MNQRCPRRFRRNFKALYICASTVRSETPSTSAISLFFMSVQIAELENFFALVRKLIDRIVNLFPQFLVFDLADHFVIVRLIKLCTPPVYLFHGGAIAIFYLTMFQYVKGTCIDSTIEESLNLLSYLYAVFSFPKLYEHVLHYILPPLLLPPVGWHRISGWGSTCGIELCRLSRSFHSFFR